MEQRSDRFAPWTGVLFVVLVAAGAVTAGNRPGAKASGQRVLSFYRAHHGSQQASAVFLTLGFIALLFFAATVRSYLHARGRGGLGSAALAGAAVLAVGQTMSASCTWSLADTWAHLSTSSAQTLNVIANDFVLTSSAGWFVFAIAAGIAIVRGIGIPTWLGWLSIVIGVLVVTPAELLGFLLFLLWTVLMTVLLWQRWIPDAQHELDERSTAEALV